VTPPRAISPEDGRRLQLAVQRDDAALGSDFARTRYTLDWQEFAVLPWGAHQVLATRLFAGLADGDLLPQRAFRIGGDTPGDLLRGLDDEYLPLRGYRSNAFRGQRALLGSLEYRFPIVELDRGPGNGQLFLRRVHGAVFYEGAQAFDAGRPRLADFRTAAGVEGRLDTDLGYLLPVTLRLVLARGFDEGGETQGYISLWLRF
jgi:outer membrane protein insertion porin family